MGTFRKISCGYAEYKAIMLIVTSVIVAIIMWIFAIGMFISRSQKNKGSSDTQKTPTGPTGPAGPAGPAEPPSMQELAPPPIWVPILFLLLGPCFIAGSIFYYRFIKNHPYMCSAMGTAKAATDATRGIASLFRGNA